MVFLFSKERAISEGRVHMGKLAILKNSRLEDGRFFSVEKRAVFHGLAQLPVGSGELSLSVQNPELSFFKKTRGVNVNSKNPNNVQTNHKKTTLSDDAVDGIAALLIIALV